MYKLKTTFALGFILLSTQIAFAKNDLGQGRLFLGYTKTDSQELKTELAAQGLKDANGINQFGIEITFPTYEYLQLGLRYNHHLLSQDELTSDSSTDYKADLKQNIMAGVARVPFYKSDYIVMDVFAAAGVAMTDYTEKTATIDGTLKNSASPYYTAGASVAFGYKQYFLFLEGGYEGNKVTDLKREGSINNNLNTLEISGTYFLVGLMFDGIPIFKK